MWKGQIRIGKYIAEVCARSDGASGLRSWGGIGHLICPDNICQLDGEFDTEIGCIFVGGYNISNKRFSFIGTGEPKIPL